MKLDDIFTIMDKFSASNLDVIKIKDGDFSIELKKHPQGGVVLPAQSTAPAVYAQTVLPADQQQVSQPVSENPTVSAGAEIVTSPIVGTFYRAPSPDALPFVEEGQKVKKGDTLCIIEAMKIMNELEAEYDMEIVRVLVENGTMVEYGTPLFEVKKI
ncbi:acetyl-CoA carboxylase biotin carboxyl carrier protein [Spirochaetia bacterium 38H-sp]|uniref:Biotin carboxyl carrier protein of acetyl-CoA carboxylase n=1 Tax=Rarispira pelagica TaxID=3141764 RepID=A0ABU9UDA3_9SPIR